MSDYQGPERRMSAQDRRNLMAADRRATAAKWEDRRKRDRRAAEPTFGVWQAIGSAPDGDEILVCLGQRVTVCIKSMGDFFDQCGMPDHFDRLPKCDPTHWMPLPQPPKEEQ